MNEREQARADALMAALQAAGYKMTSARRAVVAALVASEAHLSHAELLTRARALAPQTGRATVYRTLELLSTLGLVHTTFLGDANQRFVVPDEGHHHHLVCTRCGDVTEMAECYLDEVVARIGAQTGFTIQSHSLEFFGICAACERAGGD